MDTRSLNTVPIKGKGHVRQTCPGDSPSIPLKHTENVSCPALSYFMMLQVNLIFSKWVEMSANLGPLVNDSWIESR